MNNPFTKHPHEVGESYFEHLLEALYLFVRLTYSGLVMIIHAFVPFLFTKTASKTIFYFHARFSERLAKIAKQNKVKEELEPSSVSIEE